MSVEILAQVNEPVLQFIHRRDGSAHRQQCHQWPEVEPDTGEKVE